MGAQLALADASFETAPDVEADADLRLPEADVQVVVCGTFRRDVDGLKRDFGTLRASGCTILSPSSVDFIEIHDGFAVTSQDVGRPPTAIEREHIAAIQNADLVWLHAPDGYLGPSGAFELGVAHLAGIPTFARELPADAALSQFVRITESPSEALATLDESRLHKPGSPLRALQRYYARAAELRGWQDENAMQSLLLLTEEVGELAGALRKEGFGSTRGMPSHGESALELADVQLYVVHLANVLGIDLAAAVSLKEDINAARFPSVGRRSVAA